MAEKLMITTEKLTKDAGTVEQDIAKAENCLAQMRQAIAHLNAMWSGPSHEIYVLQFENDCKAIEEILKDLKTFADHLHTASGVYKKCSDAVDMYIDSIKL